MREKLERGSLAGLRLVRLDDAGRCEVRYDGRVVFEGDEAGCLAFIAGSDFTMRDQGRE